jgi:enoyl-CoA hydratase/carnithine racemase
VLTTSSAEEAIERAAAGPSNKGREAALAALDPIAARGMAARGQHVFDLIEQLGKPVIAAINGYALGGGCELALACTLRLASDTAKFGQPEINLGLIPGYGGTQRLPRLVGKGRALALLLGGHTIDAAEALRIGLVDRVVQAGELMTAAEALASELATKAPQAVRAILEAVNRGLDMPLPDALQPEAARDRREGVDRGLLLEDVGDRLREVHGRAGAGRASGAGRHGVSASSSPARMRW